MQEKIFVFILNPTFCMQQPDIINDMNSGMFHGW